MISSLGPEEAQWVKCCLLPLPSPSTWYSLWELLFNTSFCRGTVIFRRGSYFFYVFFSVLTKRNSDQTVAKLSLLGQRTKPAVYAMSSPAGKLIKVGSYFFDISYERGGGGNNREGELFKGGVNRGSTAIEGESFQRLCWEGESFKSVVYRRNTVLEIWSVWKIWVQLRFVKFSILKRGHRWFSRKELINPFRCDRSKSNNSDLVVFVGFVWSQFLSGFKKQIHRCKGIVIALKRMACLQKFSKTSLRYGQSKLVDTSTSRSIGCDASDAGQSVSCSMAIITRSDFDCVHEVSSKSLAIGSKKNGLHSFSRDQKRPAGTNTCPHSKRYKCGMLLLRSFHKLCHEKIFPLVCLWKQ